MNTEKYYRVWADVDIDAIRYNIQTLQKGLREGTGTCAVIKADGYGHGAVQIAKNIDDLVDFYAVATIDEGMELRSAGIRTPILVLGYVHPSMAPMAIEQEIRLTVYSREMAEEISRAAQEIKGNALIHIKLDTGMSRIGFAPGAEALETVHQISRMEGVAVEGLFTHFAASDDAAPDSALEQLRLFRDFADELERTGVRIPVKHCANSAAATYLRDADMDMVRLGISMYGLYPSCYVHQVPLQPALSLKSHVIMVKQISPGTSVGYGHTWTARQESTVATVSIGYADGYNRSLSNRGYVLIRGHKYPVIGRVCMDQLMVDITGSNAETIRQGDEVILIGKSGEACITTEEISELAGSFNYEFVCGFGRRIPRRYYRNGECVGEKDVFQVYYNLC